MTAMNLSSHKHDFDISISKTTSLQKTAKRWLPLLFAPSIFLVGCVVDGGQVIDFTTKSNPTPIVNKPDDPDKGRPECSPTYRAKAKVKGRFWIDEAGVGKTSYEQGVTNPASPTLKGKGGIEVTLHLEGGGTRKMTSCSDGWFAFSDVPKNKGLITYTLEDGCTTGNCPKPLSTTDQLNMVSFGDWLSAKAGIAIAFITPFVYQVKTVAQDVLNVNPIYLGKNSTFTSNWLPTAPDFKSNIESSTLDVSTYIFTLGETDLDNSYKKISSVYDMNKFKADTKTIVDESIKRLKLIVDGLKKKSPKANIVWVTDFDNTRMPYFKKFLNGVSDPAKRKEFETLMHDYHQQYIDELSGYKGLLVVDLVNITKNMSNADFEKLFSIDGYVKDGQALIAKHVFDVLGGFILDQNLGTTRFIGLPK